MEDKININPAALRDYIKQYKDSFNQHRLGKDGEIYKWRAVRCFQDNWNLDAPDFPEMLKAALAQTNNLLASSNFFPRRMIKEFAKTEPETVRGMFHSLFNEGTDVIQRVKAFEYSSSLLRDKYFPGKSTYQDPNSISTYLWLRFPDKYYIYKYGEAKEVAKKICGLGMPTDKYDRLSFGFALFDALSDELAKDRELAKLSRNSLTDDAYPDNALKTLTVDMVFFISRHELSLVSGVPVNTAKEESVSKNTILYGPPGTGKTYGAVQYAVSIIEEKSLSSIVAEDYSAVSQRYRKYRDNGLVAFTTFHQSYGYEEFIEGIRPVVLSDESSGSSKNIEYEIRDGVFKAFCDKAQLSSPHKNELNFDEAWAALVEAAENKGGKYVFTRRTGTSVEFILHGDDKFRVTWNSDIGSHNDITKSSVYKHWISQNSSKASLTGGSRWLFAIREAITDELKKKFKLQSVEPAEKQNYVFIIDEINRGNISKIFGELITLIEPTKRIGAPEALIATLPYSGKDFGVPDNVYIIGTMNTADRSIAMMDTALRRRFDFVEMMPDSNLLEDVSVDGLNIAEMLDTMNKRIAVLLDREHTIGHSYLLPLKADPSIENLASIFENRIIPLLQEYFYDDYRKIQLVLGDNQKNDDSLQIIVEKSDVVKLFGSADTDYSNYYEINSEAFRRIEAYEFLK